MTSATEVNTRGSGNGGFLSWICPHIGQLFAGIKKTSDGLRTGVKFVGLVTEKSPDLGSHFQYRTLSLLKGSTAAMNAASGVCEVVDSVKKKESSLSIFFNITSVLSDTWEVIRAFKLVQLSDKVKLFIDRIDAVALMSNMVHSMGCKLSKEQQEVGGDLSRKVTLVTSFKNNTVFYLKRISLFAIGFFAFSISFVVRPGMLHAFYAARLSAVLLDIYKEGASKKVEPKEEIIQDSQEDIIEVPK
jgi:hypothetical protein